MHKNPYQDEDKIIVYKLDWIKWLLIFCMIIHTKAAKFNLNSQSQCAEVVQSTTDLLVESRRVRAHAEVGFSCRLVNVLQTVSIGVHDQTRVVVEQHAHAVVTELVA